MEDLKKRVHSYLNHRLGADERYVEVTSLQVVGENVVVEYEVTVVFNNGYVLGYGTDYETDVEARTTTLRLSEV